MQLGLFSKFFLIGMVISLSVTNAKELSSINYINNINLFFDERASPIIEDSSLKFIPKEEEVLSFTIKHDTPTNKKIFSSAELHIDTYLTDDYLAKHFRNIKISFVNNNQRLTYSEVKKILKFHIELYQEKQKLYSLDFEKMKFNRSLEKKKKGEIIYVIDEIDISKLEAGNYYLKFNVEVRKDFVDTLVVDYEIK